MATAPPSTRIITGPDLHETVVEEQLLNARHHVWIATANLKDMHIRRGRRFRPALEALDEMAGRGVKFRVVHGSLPSQPFRKSLEAYPTLTGGALELQICLRSHWKIVLVDGAFAYWGSANFTGAGLGVKGTNKRNLEIGSVSQDPAMVAQIANLFDTFWIGEHCEACALRATCPDPIR